MEWKEQYRHPNWQKKRLEALEAAGFTCQRCGDTETSLHVHHKRYVKGRNVWEYGADELDILCEPCHEQTHADKDLLNELLSKVPASEISSVTAVVTGFCGYAYGLNNTNEVAEKLNNPFGFTVGLLAGATSMMNIHSLIALLSAVEINYNGGTIHLVIPPRKSFGD